MIIIYFSFELNNLIWFWTKKFYCSESKLEKHISDYLAQKNLLKLKYTYDFYSKS